MESEALELALALYRAPSQRHALREMELPHDISVLIQLASAPQPLLQETAAGLDETENTVLEASRFYLQQTLFQPDASAYRVLGLARDATPERIREHYRWLQRWLHPDRRGEDWEALLATRVNWAWGRLRNETARNVYNLEQEQDDPVASDSEHTLEQKPLGDWRLIPIVHERRSRTKTIAIGALFCSCLALLYVALTRDESLMQEDPGTRSSAAASAVTARTIEPQLRSPVTNPVMAVPSVPVPAERAEAISSDAPNLATQAAGSSSPPTSLIEEQAPRSETGTVVPQTLAVQPLAKNVHSDGDADLSRATHHKRALMMKSRALSALPLRK